METLTRLVVAVLVILGGAPTLAQLPQNPSPMNDSTRPHPRVVPYEPKGQRAPVGEGTLFIRDGLKPAATLPLIVHFHGDPWIVEHHIARMKQKALLVTFNLGEGSGQYAKRFTTPAQFAAVLDEAAAAAGRLLGRPVKFDPVILSSFSAGYGAVRAIMRQPEHYSRVATVMLNDSLHADYLPEAVAPRSPDLSVAPADVDVFLKLAGDAVAGRKRFIVLHSEVFPGTYASTTDTADALLASVHLKRRAKLREGPLGMQQLSETKQGKFVMVGYAGNSAIDHLDQLYALGAQLAKWKATKR